jgi:hypothetical protein
MGESYALMVLLGGCFFYDSFSVTTGSTLGC